MKKLLIDSKKYVTELLSTKLDEDYLYHNANHTLQVLETTKELIKNNKDKSVNEENLLLAALFQFTGFTVKYDGYETASCDIARKFLENKNVKGESIENICELILAAKSGKEPKNTEEKILKDATNYYYAHEEFLSQAELLRIETDQKGKKKYSVAEWREKNLQDFQTEHRFYTKYALENWQDNKMENLAKVVGKIKKGDKTIKKERLKVRLKNESPERAIQSMYRVALRNHLKLSDIADTKANILLSVNAIIISLLMANLIPQLNQPQKEYLTYPTAIFVLFSVASMIMSVLATRPKVDNGEFSDDDLDSNKANLLFFGNFHSMELNDYKNSMRNLTKNKQDIYDSLSADLYFLGKVLNEKYKLLRLTYTIFITGIIFSVIAFAIALKFYSSVDILEAVTP
ncbi:DUF5706 domain-containing protein [Aureibaculum sp. 2210JD6-5]|uniref:Pycsar system effector family protein n=1 Tax=Aureibaculum sp. 2210JD6-5 TaxID=3103957 RepID=UPI002AAC6D57|nr:Pycsar system effector family protein [Aureibaculum sp. 2210JD6-5]MDY7394959.1 DUF5706 domain-containing protein [Aureibaculum sp. 2210JD6-5]